MLSFNVDQLVTSLQRVPPQFRAALAAAAASRLIGTYSNRHLLFDKGQPVELSAALQCVWSEVCHGATSHDEIQAHLKLATQLAEREETPTSLDAYADKAAAAVVYALRTILSTDLQDAITAVRCVYDAAFQYAIRRSGARTIPPGSLQLLRSHPVVQQELRRQLRDLDQLCSADSAHLQETALRLKKTSENESAIPLEEEARN